MENTIKYEKARFGLFYPTGITFNTGVFALFAYIRGKCRISITNSLPLLLRVGTSAMARQ